MHSVFESGGHCTTPLLLWCHQRVLTFSDPSPPAAVTPCLQGATIEMDFKVILQVTMATLWKQTTVPFTFTVVV